MSGLACYTAARRAGSHRCAAQFRGRVCACNPTCPCDLLWFLDKQKLHSMSGHGLLRTRYSKPSRARSRNCSGSSRGQRPSASGTHRVCPGGFGVPAPLNPGRRPRSNPIAGCAGSRASRLASGTEPQLVKMPRSQRTMPPANGRQQQFSQLPRIVFGRVILCPKIAQGFAHDLPWVGVAPRPDFTGDETLEVFCQRHFHRCIFVSGVARVNGDKKLDGRRR